MPITTISRAKLRLRVGLAAAVVGAITSVLVMFSSPVHAADPSVTGQWSSPIDMGGVGIHATLTYNGELLFFQYAEGKAGVDKTSFVETYNIATGLRQTVQLPYNRDLFCSAHIVLSNGNVYVTGGHDHDAAGKQDGTGAAETDTWNPTARTWTAGPLLSQKRWYPTTVGLANNNALTFGGNAAPGVNSNTVDSYNPATNVMTQLPSSATKKVGLYPQNFAMANGKVFRVTKSSQYFDPATNRWGTTLSTMASSHNRGFSVLLNGATKVLTFGGDGTSSAALRTTEMIDTSAATPRWQTMAPMNHGRTLHNGVVLPDGTVLAIGGGVQFKYTSPQKIPELYNPATNTWTDMAPQQAGRMYHSTALLLPDGRVMSNGQDSGTFAKKMEIFSPPYLFKGARPTVTGAPSQVGYGSQFSFSTESTANISSVALIRSGSVTHGTNTDQRHIALNFTNNGGTITASAPANAQIAPAGYYMLFIVNSDGVPSVAPWVHVG